MRHVPTEEVRRVLDDLATLGADSVELTRMVGLCGADLEPGAPRISVEQVARIFAHAAHRAQDAHVGLHAATHTTLNHLVALLAASQPTLGAALEQLRRFQPLLFGAAALGLDVGTTTTRLVLHVANPTDLFDHVTEYYLMTLARELVGLAGPVARALEVHVPHAPAGAGAEVERCFGCAVRFRAPHAVLCLSRGAMAARLPNANPFVAESLIQLAVDQLERLAEQSLHDRVAQALRAAMAGTGDAHCGPIARQLAMSVRTLQRRLSDEGLTFRQLRDTVRRQVAIGLTDDTAQASVNDLAVSVGFADSATLCRAFKRWTGMSPGTYRGGRTQPASAARPAIAQ